MRLDRRLTTALLLIVLGALSGCLRTRGVSMDDWLGASYSRTYAAPTPAQAAALTAAFDAALLGQAEQPWSAVHYESWRWPDGFALRETAPPSLGWGAYVFRERPARALLVQAPHADSDRLTGTVALAVYRLTQARAVAINSAHRRLAGADQANVDGAPFALLSEAALLREPTTVVLQLHGYGRDTADRHGLSAATVVVSNGTREPDDALRAQAACLVQRGFDARVFPEQAGYPGGTGNAVRRVVDRHAGARFVHLELGADLRERLTRQPDLLGTFAACL